MTETKPTTQPAVTPATAPAVPMPDVPCTMDAASPRPSPLRPIPPRDFQSRRGRTGAHSPALQARQPHPLPVPPGDPRPPAPAAPQPPPPSSRSGRTSRSRNASTSASTSSATTPACSWPWTSLPPPRGAALEIVGLLGVSIDFNKRLMEINEALLHAHLGHQLLHNSPKPLEHAALMNAMSRQRSARTRQAAQRAIAAKHRLEASQAQAALQQPPRQAAPFSDRQELRRRMHMTDGIRTPDTDRSACAHPTRRAIAPGAPDAPAGARAGAFNPPNAPAAPETGTLSAAPSGRFSRPPTDPGPA